MAAILRTNKRKREDPEKTTYTDEDITKLMSHARNVAQQKRGERYNNGYTFAKKFLNQYVVEMVGVLAAANEPFEISFESVNDHFFQMAYLVRAVYVSFKDDSQNILHSFASRVKNFGGNDTFCIGGAQYLHDFLVKHSLKFNITEEDSSGGPAPKKREFKVLFDFEFGK